MPYYSAVADTTCHNTDLLVIVNVIAGLNIPTVNKAGWHVCAGSFDTKLHSISAIEVDVISCRHNTSSILLPIGATALLLNAAEVCGLRQYIQARVFVNKECNLQIDCKSSWPGLVGRSLQSKVGVCLLESTEM